MAGCARRPPAAVTLRGRLNLRRTITGVNRSTRRETVRGRAQGR